jgi:hypothetical protein
MRTRAEALPSKRPPAPMWAALVYGILATTLSRDCPVTKPHRVALLLQASN